MAKQNKAIGIDLGTCNSCVAVYQQKRVHIIENEAGSKTTPSMVAFTSAERLIGEAAKNQFMLNPQNTVFDIKRLIGRRFKDDTVQRDLGLWPFRVVRGKKKKPMVEVEFKGFTRKFSAEEISCMILWKLKKTSETFLKAKVRDAVITVPAYFSDAQRQATRDAATIAGLNVLQIMNEPIAAAIAYGLDNKSNSSSQAKFILVFDLGGGTFDISLLSIKKNVFKVVATDGDSHLGGSDFDNNLVDYCSQKFKQKYNGDISRNPRALRRLLTACERAKKCLSSAMETVIELESLSEDKDFRITITRTQFEELNMELFQKCIKSVDKCLAGAKVLRSEVEDVVLVGGSTRIPKLRQMIQRFFRGKELCNAINPDEAVAYGAAVQAAVLIGHRIDLTVMDVTPLSLGIDVEGDLMDVVVPKNTSIPTRKEVLYTTSLDNQAIINISVFQGERAHVEDNYYLGEFTLSGIPAAPRGEVSIAVCFEIDGSGILKVSAEHKNTGVRSEIVVNSEDVGGLSKEEMERALIDAERFEVEDEEIKKITVKRLDFEKYSYKMRERVRQEKLKGLMDMDEIENIEKYVKEAIEWAEGHDDAECEKLDEKMQELKTICNALVWTSCTDSDDSQGSHSDKEESEVES
ncbi:hypothetical protein KI387_035530 [Taxus chinensis]|uniref:Heat shock protein 70 n=1 Tax=Taxus chinensis TaxID=29808 RepID=A0AA38FPI4_TAXCH|nr:hypothetical protein KI387_035530 [Taxus chinensis]